jgi:site-specific DNA recombinase
MTSENIPVLIRARISRDPEFTMSAVERHVRLCLRLVQAHDDWSLLPVQGSLKDPTDPAAGRWPDGVLVDNNVTVGKGKATAEYKRLMAAVDAGQVRVIVAYNQARLWRNRKARADGFERCTTAGIRLEFIKGTAVDFRDASSRLVADIIGATDEWYLQITSENQRATAADHAERGAWHGKRPFGFDLVPAPGPKRGGERSLTVNDKEADALREVYVRTDPDVPELIRWTPWQACRWLDEQGILTVTGMSWHEAGPGSLTAILCAARNIGLREHAEGWDGRGHRPYAKRGSSNLHSGNWPALIEDAELFWRVREMLTDPGRRRSGPKQEAQHLLTGLVWCGRCGGPMYVQHNRSRPRWTCQRCWTVRALDQVNAKALRLMVKWMDVKGPYDRAMAATESADVAGLRLTLKSLRRKRQEVIDDYYDEKITREDYSRQLARKDEQISEARNRLGAWGEQGQTAGIQGRGPAFARQWQAMDGQGAAGLDEQRQIVAQLIGRVVIHPAGRTNAPSSRLIVVEPGSWAGRLADPGEVAAPVVPDHQALTSRGRAIAVLVAAGGRWMSAREVAAALGQDPRVTTNLLRRMRDDGVTERAWLPYGTGPANEDSTIEAERAAAPSGTLRGAGCHGFRLVQGAPDGSRTGVDNQPAPITARPAVPTGAS